MWDALRSTSFPHSTTLLPMARPERSTSGWLGLGEKERRDSDIRHLSGLHPCLTPQIQMVLDALPTPAMAWDAVPAGGFRVAAVNDLFAAVTGKSAIVGAPPHELYSRNVAEQVSLELARVAAEKRAHSFEAEMPVTQGRGWWKLSLRPLSNAAGQCVRIICTMTDITNQKMAENTLIQQRDEMRRLALTDAATGLGNRRAFLEFAAREIGRSRRYARPLSLLVFDIDHFKKVNDTLGHPAGDAALEAVGRCCQHLLRSTDFCARLGGDEFALVLPETSLEDAHGVAERLRKHLDDAKVSADDKAMPIRISIGATHLLDDDDIASLLARADEALYTQKSNGGNGTTVTYI